MRVLVIENYPLTPHGQVGRALRDAGAEVTVVKAFEGEAVPQNAAGYSGLAVFGGGQNALDDEGSPFLPQVCGLIRGFHEEQKPVLGICLGSQLIARAFGGRNIIGRPIEFGWHEVRPTEAGKADPVLSALDEGAPLFHWHNDTFDLPDGAVHLAASDQTPHQAFRMGAATYGIQFHFEAAEPEVRDWSRDFAGMIADTTPDWQDRLETEIARHAPRADATGARLAASWVRLLG